MSGTNQMLHLSSRPPNLFSLPHKIVAAHLKARNLFTKVGLLRSPIFEHRQVFF